MHVVVDFGIGLAPESLHFAYGRSEEITRNIWQTEGVLSYDFEQILLFPSEHNFSD